MASCKFVDKVTIGHVFFVLPTPVPDSNISFSADAFLLVRKQIDLLAAIKMQRANQLNCLVFIHVIFRLHWMCDRKLPRNRMKYLLMGFFLWFFIDYILMCARVEKWRPSVVVVVATVIIYSHSNRIKMKKKSIIFAYTTLLHHIPFPLNCLRRFHNTNKTNHVCKMHSRMISLSIEHTCVQKNRGSIASTVSICLRLANI